MAISSLIDSLKVGDLVVVKLPDIDGVHIGSRWRLWTKQNCRAEKVVDVKKTQFTTESGTRFSKYGKGISKDVSALPYSKNADLIITDEQEAEHRQKVETITKALNLIDTRYGFPDISAIKNIDDALAFAKMVLAARSFYLELVNKDSFVESW